MGSDRQALRHSLLNCMGGAESDFDGIALGIFEYQLAHNSPYRKYCTALGQSQETVTRWQDIPPVPADAFKSCLPLTCFPPENTIRTFLTSGTTSETKGEHHFCDLELYESAIIHGWRHAKLPELLQAYFASRPPAETPNSSLGHMFQTLCPDHSPDRWLATPGHGFDITSLIGQSTPLVLFGTSLSLLHLCHSTNPIALPAGSRVFQTGGFKGVSAEHNPEELSDQICRHFNIAEDQLIHEYGMTELSSQSYAPGKNSNFRCPPWLRVQVIDPATGHSLPSGEPGYLVLYDLANLDSVLAVRTQDFARMIDHSTFQLLGRDPVALPRGCSRASDSFFQSAS